MQNPRQKRFGELLIDYGLLEPLELEKALNIQHETGEKLGKVLRDHGFVSKQDLLKILGLQMGISQLNLSSYFIDPAAVKLIPESLARKHKAIPVKREGQNLVVAMSNPLDVFAIDDIRITSSLEIKPILADDEDITTAINQYYTMQETIEQALDEMATSDEDLVTTIETEVEASEKAPVVKLVNSLIEQGIRDGASDIHIEPGEDLVKIRYRIDGILHENMRYPKYLHNAVIARIKIISNLDITKKRLPQDGRKRFEIEGAQVDLRISTLPTIHGEKVALRLLNRDNYFRNLSQLGLLDKDYERYKEMVGMPYGMILVSGPTGSGKTTTLYSTLQSLDCLENNIVTIEDPVEYVLDDITQIQVQPKIGLTFAEGLRSILRQDPNIIMVGEIRDSETADIAVRAALTGHLVFSTIHTNDSASAITRLIDMGIEPFLIATSVIGVIAQRLVRLLCPHCKVSYEAKGQELLALGLKGPVTAYKATGCPLCNDTGYRGRTAIYEVLRLTGEHRKLIAEKMSTDEIKDLSLKKGMKTLKQNGVELVLRGATTVEEILKITAVEN